MKDEKKEMSLECGDLSPLCSWRLDAADTRPSSARKAATGRSLPKRRQGRRTLKICRLRTRSPVGRESGV